MRHYIRNNRGRRPSFPYIRQFRLITNDDRRYNLDMRDCSFVRDRFDSVLDFHRYSLRWLLRYYVANFWEEDEKMMQFENHRRYLDGYGSTDGVATV